MKPGGGQNFGIPNAVQDIIYSLIDGYKSTLLAFGKFQVRQRQQLEYKIERLSKLNQDLREESSRQKAYDKFLKKKMENLQEEMLRIEAMVE